MSSMSRAQSFSKPRLKRQKKAQVAGEMEAILNKRVSYASHDEILKFQLNEQNQLNPLSQQFEPGRLSLANTDVIDVRSHRSKRGKRTSEASSIMELKLQVLQDQLSVKESESAMKDHKIEELQRKLRLLGASGDVTVGRASSSQTMVSSKSHSSSADVVQKLRVSSAKVGAAGTEGHPSSASPTVNLKQSPYKPKPPTQKPIMNRHSSASRASRSKSKTMMEMVGFELLFLSTPA